MRLAEQDFVPCENYDPLPRLRLPFDCPLFYRQTVSERDTRVHSMTGGRYPARPHTGCRRSRILARRHVRCPRLADRCKGFYRSFSSHLCALAQGRLTMSLPHDIVEREYPD
jgi:hypothetical protein